MFGPEISQNTQEQFSVRVFNVAGAATPAGVLFLTSQTLVPEQTARRLSKHHYHAPSEGAPGSVCTVRDSKIPAMRLTRQCSWEPLDSLHKHLLIHRLPTTQKINI